MTDELVAPPAPPPGTFRLVGPRTWEYRSPHGFALVVALDDDFGRAVSRVFALDVNDLWMLSDISVDREHRGDGEGRQLLARVCADADARSMGLLLAVGDGEGALGRDELRQWYERAGFVCLPLEDDSYVMVRPPARQEPPA